ncbi:MAG: hypothetical protein FWB78_07520 [Treponema sp.]|nr:hypothetical protein [Treponema sp.]
MGKSLGLFRIRSFRFCAIAMVVLIGFSIAACEMSGNGLEPTELAGSVSITGIPRVGETLGVNVRNLDGSGDVSFEWMVDGQPFANNRGATLRLDALHVGSTFTVTVSTSDNYGGVTSFPVGPVIVAGGILPPLTGSIGITGIPQVGQTLRANIDYLEGNGAISYEWKIDGDPFENNRGMILPLDILHRDRNISVTVRRENNSGCITSDSIGPIGAGTMSALTGSVSITGSPHMGQTLRVNVNSLGGSGEIFHEWMVGNQTVGTGGTLFLIPGDVGQPVTVTVRRENNFGYVTSLSVGPVTQRPLLTGTIGITGMPQVGQTLRVDTASLGGSGAMSFDWKVGDAIAGTANTLSLVDAHIGQYVTVTVRRANNDGSVTSSAAGPVVAIPPLTGTIGITGIPQVGQTLRVDTASLGGSGAMSFVWRVGGSQVGTGNSLLLQSVHVGQMVTVTVTRAGNTGSATSPSVGPVTAAPLPPPPSPTAITITVTGIPGRYIHHWGAIDLESSWAGWVAESAWLRITGSSATFTMRTFDGAPFNISGTYRVHFSIDDDMGEVGNYSVMRGISAGNNSIPFTAFTPVFSGFSEGLESTEEGGGSRAGARRWR